jgi:hypothetical protein
MKKDILHNAIEVNFLVWKVSVYIYVYPCSLDAFDFYFYFEDFVLYIIKSYHTLSFLKTFG